MSSWATTSIYGRSSSGLNAGSSQPAALWSRIFRTRDLLVRQRTQTINALRGHLAEFGVVAPRGRAKITQLVGVLEDGDSALPEAVVELGRLLLERIDGLDEKIDGLDRRLRASAREN